MKDRLLTNWNVWRITRLVLSIIILVNGIYAMDTILILAGVFLFGQAIINTCVTCSSGNCEVSQNKTIRKI